MPPTILNFNGKTCTRVTVTNLANGNVVFDTNSLTNYQVSFISHPECISMYRYNQDVANNLLLVAEHRIFNYDSSLVCFNITY